MGKYIVSWQILDPKIMSEASKKVLITASIIGAMGVLLGAFGAHGLKPLLVENHKLATFETAVTYHFYHTFALLALGILYDRLNHKRVRICFWLFMTGTIVFSGSLYALSVTNISVLGAITPIGGILLVMGWIYMALAIKEAN